MIQRYENYIETNSMNIVFCFHFDEIVQRGYSSNILFLTIIHNGGIFFRKPSETLIKN